MDKFSLQSRRAIIMFTATFLVLVLIPRIYFYFHQVEAFSLSEKIQQEPESKQKELKRKIYSYHQKKHTKGQHKYFLPPSKFNPNDYQLEDWMNLGLSEKQAKTILNFNKYGFHSVQDMQKCFVFQNESFFDMIKDSLVFSKQTIGSKYDQAMSRNLAVDLNKASKEELKKLKGIGDYYADKIIAYRTRLGGYLSVNQLLEIYRFDQEKLSSIKPYLLLNKNDVHQIDLNKVSTKELKNHPYINDWNLANSIVKMREQKGGYKTIAEIKESVLMTDSIYDKIQPYLKIE